MKKSPILWLAVMLLAGSWMQAHAQAEPPAGETDAEESRPNLGWPREYSGEDYRMVVYQPQIREWTDYRQIEADLAILLTSGDSDDPVAGAIKLKAQTDTHMDTRTVFVHDVELEALRLPEIEGTPRERVEEIVRSAFPDKPVAVSLDRILAGISKSEVRGRKVELNAAPPPIFVSQKPALLVNIDGEAAWVPTGVDGLSFAANTNWDLFKNDQKKRKTKTYYLRHGSTWLATDDLEGPWGPGGKLPKAFKKLPLNDSFRDVRMNVPGRELPASQLPAVFVSHRPAELLVIDGEPKLAPVPDTSILVVDNTEADLFRHIDDGHYYYLVAGRWFKNDDLEGEWSAATGQLPEDFADIPEDHDKHHVLASVPGTAEAEEAVLQAQIPTVAEVSREEAPDEVKIEYVGDPEFRDIDGTSLAYAVNTSSDIVKKGDSYYLCTQGIWFVSASPTGPWTVADKVPGEIYEIPASSPVHHTTYVYVYDSTPSTVIYGYTPGYMGMYVSWGCVVWGTGWYYDPYYYYGPHYRYPIYYPYPYTYGAGAWYNPSTGFYGRGYSYYGPYGGAGRGAAYNPATGTYKRGGYAYGVGGAAAWGQAYNPRTGTRAAGYRAADPYSSWGRGVVSRGDKWLEAGYYSDARGNVRGFRDSAGRAGGVVDTGAGRAGVVRGQDDLYVGRDGNVFRRDEDGWSKYGGRDGGWEKVGEGMTPEQRRAARDRAATRSGSGSATRDLDRYRAGRDRGNARSGRYDNWRSSGGWSGSARGRSLPARGGGRMGGFRR